MAYPRQDSVARRLGEQNLRALDDLKDELGLGVGSSWARTRRLIMADIAAAYRASGVWSLPSFQAGAYRPLSMRVFHLLGQMHRATSYQMGQAFRDLRRQARLRALWALDQVTPQSRPVRYANPTSIREAGMPNDPGWQMRWSEWVTAWGQALMANLRMNALNEGSLQDAMGEVDATRASTPAYTLDAALQRLYEYESAQAVAAGMHQAVEDNPDLVEEEVWRTRGDLRVCDDCDANEGLTAEETDEDIPLHPNCNCFWQIVPASFAALLRSGDQADRDLARALDYKGVAPNAMAVTGPDGQPAGKIIVDFEEWANTNVAGGISR